MKTVYSFLAFFCFALICISSCKKDKSDATDDRYKVTGIDLRDVSAVTHGQLGNPGDVTKTDSLELEVYPNPFDQVFSVSCRIRNGKSKTLKFTIVHAVYPDAPASYTINGKTVAIQIENQNLTGKEILTRTEDFPANTEWYRKDILFNLKDTPKGFYKLFVETGDGEELSVGILRT